VTAQDVVNLVRRPTLVVQKTGDKPSTADMAIAAVAAASVVGSILTRKLLPSVEARHQHIHWSPADDANRRGAFGRADLRCAEDVDDLQGNNSGAFFIFAGLFCLILCSRECDLMLCHRAPQQPWACTLPSFLTPTAFILAPPLPHQVKSASRLGLLAAFRARLGARGGDVAN